MALPPPRPDVHLLTLDRTQRGIGDFSEVGTVPACEALPFEEAFAKPYEDDRHFVCYSIFDADGLPVNASPKDFCLPRLRKGSLASARKAFAESNLSLLCHVACLDIDNPGHAPHPEGVRLAPPENLTGVLADWAVWYPTNHGYRLVYRLEKPQEPEAFEGIVRWLASKFTSSDSSGSAVADDKVFDWTRLFRLPLVVRDGEPTWEQPWADIEIRTDRRISPARLAIIPEKGPETLPSLPVLYAPTAVQPGLGTMPDIEDSRQLVEAITGDGRVRTTAFARFAAKRLQGRRCFPCLFEGAPLAEKGSRDSTLMEYIGQVVGLLYEEGNVNIEQVFGLFIPAIETLDPDPQTPDWYASAWAKLSRVWAHEQNKEAQRLAREQQQEEQEEQTMQTIVNNVRLWCEIPEVHDEDPEIAAAAVMRMAIAIAGSKSYYLLTPNGRYWPKPFAANQLIPAIRTHGMDAFIATRNISSRGIATDRTITEIINECGVVVDRVVGRPEAEVHCARPGREPAEAVLRNRGTPSAELDLPLFGRNPHIEPVYSEPVDEWLQAFFGEHYDKGTEWLAWALAFEKGPIAALSIVGPPGVGKGLLAQGLAETLRTPALADASDLIGKFQYGLQKSPFLVINEGWPVGPQAARPADRFRSLVAGDPLQIERKFMDPVLAYNPVRILLTANNMSLVKALGSGQDLSPEDRDALAIRLVHIQVSTDASTHLASRGGTQHTGRQGNRWVQGAAGQSSDYVLAKHLLWLHKHHESRLKTKPPGSRFLVEGNLSDEIMYQLRTQTGSSPAVVESLIRAFNERVLPKGFFFDEMTGSLFCLPAGVLLYYRDRVQATAAIRLSLEQVTSSLKGLSQAGSIADGTRVVEPGSGSNLARPERWQQMDMRMLSAAAQQNGWDSRKIRKALNQLSE